MKKVQALRMGENAEEHRSKDLVLEVLKWNFPSHSRGRRQEWWGLLLKEIPEIKEYVGETKETDHPEKASKELLSKIAKFIVKNEPIYESQRLDVGYKYLVGLEDQETPVLIMAGINVNPSIETMDLVYNAGVGAIVEGEIIGANTWEDGEVMINHKVLYEFDPDDPAEILEGMIRYGEHIFIGFWYQEGIEALYEAEYYNEYEEEWENESLDEFKERIKKDQESKLFRQGKVYKSLSSSKRIMKQGKKRINVRKHKRRLKSGRSTIVKKHKRRIMQSK